MNEIRAFVGHSFVEADANLVEKFLKYFDRISKLIPNFSWVHAEAAEPPLLTDKVLSLIENKNVFIGICTKKELVIEAGSLSSSLIAPSYRRAKSNDFQWKTSDWILQEIGLAKGRGLELVLLVEDGLRQPGGLQGNVEYISFEREAPEKSFGKILEMITALSPGAAAESSNTTAVVASAPVTEEKSLPGADDGGSLAPSNDWTEENFENAIFRAVIGSKKQAISQINEAYLASSYASENDNAAVWSARLEWLKVLFNDGEMLNKIRKIASENPNNAKVVGYLARSLAEYEYNSEAAEQFELAANLTQDPVEKIRLKSSALQQYAKAGKIDDCSHIVREIKSEAGADKEAEVEVSNALKDFYEATKQNCALIAVMERIVELAPDDVNTRFLLGYEQSEAGNRELALLHYRKIPHQLRHSGTWNNLGVVLDQFNMPTESVQAYREAEKKGETLAMANLGYKLLAAGFIDQAQELCDKALSIKDYHKNIGELLVRIKNVSEEEAKKRDEVVEKAEPKAEFFRLAGAAILALEPDDIGASWQGPDGSLTLVRNGATVEISGAFERDPSPLLLALSGAAATRAKTKHKIEFTGTLRGRLIEGSVKRTDDGPKSLAATSLGIGDGSTPVLMLVNANGDEIRVMENPFEMNPTYYALKRQI